MKVVAAYLLACLGGNSQPSANDVKSILSSGDIDVDDKRIQLFMSQIEGKDITEIVAAGREQLASVPAGGGAGVAVAAAPSGGAAPATAESKKEEVEEKEESEDDLGFSLFD